MHQSQQSCSTATGYLHSCYHFVTQVPPKSASVQVVSTMLNKSLASIFAWRGNRSAVFRTASQGNEAKLAPQFQTAAQETHRSLSNG